MEQLRSNVQRGKIAIIFIWIVIAINFLSLLESQMINFGIVRLDTFSSSESNFYQILYYVVYTFPLLYLVALGVSATMFMRWFRRAYYNLGVLTGECVYDDSWAVKAWFVPFLNLYRPYKMMKELFEETDKYLFENYMLGGNILYAERLKIDVLKWWWGTSLAIVLKYIILLFFPAYLFGMVGCIIIGLMRLGLFGLSGMLLISIITNYQKKENLLTVESPDNAKGGIISNRNAGV